MLFLLPSKVLFELWNALAFHLFEQNKVDPTRIAALLEDRQEQHRSDAPEVAFLMQASIDSLKSLRPGQAMPPPTVH